MASEHTSNQESSGKRRNKRQKEQDINVDMNPMVDLAFLLLTFFMLTTTFSKPQVMELVMPVQPEEGAVEQEQAVKESKAVTLVLDGEDAIFWYQGVTDPVVQQTDYSNSGIRQLLKEWQQNIDGMVLLIKPGEAARFENLVDVLDEVNLSKIERYAIVDLEPAEAALIQSFKYQN